MSTLELVTLLKHIEQTNPGTEVYMEVSYPEANYDVTVTRTRIVALKDVRWTLKGPVLVSGRVE